MMGLQLAVLEIRKFARMALLTLLLFQTEVQDLTPTNGRKPQVVQDPGQMLPQEVVEQQILIQHQILQ